MTWKDYQSQGLVTPHKTSKRELDELRAAVARNLKDAAIEELSDDNRFGIAYQATLLIAKMAVGCAGYRVKGSGAHHTTFEVIPLALGSQYQPTADYLNVCRRKRNDIAYDSEGVVSTQDVQDLVNKANDFRNDVEDWIANHHPAFQ